VIKPDDLFVSNGFSDDLAKATRGDTVARLRVGYAYCTGRAGAINFVRARHHFRVAATQSTEASALLGFLDLKLHRNAPLNTAALKRLQQAANANDPVGRTLLGRAYEQGLRPCKQNLQTAQALYEAAAPHFALAKTYLGAMLLKTGKAKQGIRLLKQAATAGEGSSMLHLADLYVRQRKTTHIEKAKSLLRAGAELGHCAPLYRLGVLYRDGTGVPASAIPTLGFALMHRAAKAGHRPAQAAVGVAYKNGTGVKQNLKLAGFWTQKAAQVLPH